MKRPVAFEKKMHPWGGSATVRFTALLSPPYVAPQVVELTRPTPGMFSQYYGWVGGVSRWYKVCGV